MARIAYLGPEGTFTEAALSNMAAAGVVPAGFTPGTDGQHPGRPWRRCGPARPTSPACRSRTPSGGVLPTLDSLATGAPLQIYAELTLDVAFSIVTRPGTSAAEVKTVAAFPVAAAQVRNWLAANLPGAETVLARSTRPPPPTSRPVTPTPG